MTYVGRLAVAGRVRLDTRKGAREEAGGRCVITASEPGPKGWTGLQFPSRQSRDIEPLSAKHRWMSRTSAYGRHFIVRVCELTLSRGRAVIVFGSHSPLPS